MSVEWQARQFALAVSELGPLGNMLSPAGRSTLVDLNANSLAARAQGCEKAMAAMRVTGSMLRTITSSSSGHNRRLFDDIAHEPARVPIRRTGLRLASHVGAADHQNVVALARQREADLPAPEAICSFILAELGPGPALSPVAREVDARNARSAAERNAARERRSAGLQFIARLDVGDEGSWIHPVDRHRLHTGRAGLDIAIGRIRDPVGGLRPEIRIRLVELLDVVEHLDPIGGIPAGHDEPQREAVQQGKRLPGSCIGQHHLAIARMIDVERFHEVRRIRQDGIVHAFETNLHRTRLHAGVVEHDLQANAGPARVSHGAVRPLPSRDPRLEITARVSRTLIDGRKLDPRERERILYPEIYIPVNMPTLSQT